MAARQKIIATSYEDSSSELESVEDHGELCDAQDFAEDTYSMVACSIIRDMHFMRKGNTGESHGARGIRIFTTVFCLFVTTFLQIYLVCQIKKYVTAKAVHDARAAYDVFETKMYAAGGLTKTANGFNRGDGTSILTSHFTTLAQGDQEAICTVPFSQPFFFEAILFIWTLTCMREIKNCYHLFISLIWNTMKAKTMGHCFEAPSMNECGSKGGQEQFEMFKNLSDALDEGNKLICQLTPLAKALVVLFVLLPQVIITFGLLWLGCRWLAATMDFGDLILNSVALEFILMLKEVIFMALIPVRCKNDLSRTKLLPIRYTLGMGWRSLAGMLVIFFISALWVYLYIFHLQTVLPDYQFDIREVCSSWITERYSV